jgi:branched-chain amino acid transport system substrate-binding protein
LKVQSPGGEIEMRACDHQAVLPMYLGVTKKSEELGIGVATDIVTLTGDEVMPSCEEVLQSRE